MSAKKFFLKNRYLSDLDILNKYNYQSIFLIPKLEVITITLLLSNFLYESEEQPIILKDKELQVQAFLLLYVLFTFIPHLQSKHVVLKVISNKSIPSDYALKITLSTFYDINEFLFLIFIENWKKISLSDRVFFKNKRIKSSNSSSLLHATIDIRQFTFLPVFFSTFLPSVNLRKVILHVTFKVIRNFDTRKSQEAFSFKNLPLFWLVSV